MSQSTWHNITTGMRNATHKGYMRKSSRQRSKHEVADVWNDYDRFCDDTEKELAGGRYRVGPYRHFRLKDKKKARDISVLPFRDRCVQNDVKEAIEPLLLRQMTDDMMGGLPGRGILAGGATHFVSCRRCQRRSTGNHRHQVVAQMKRLLNDQSLHYYLQGDIRKFYDTVDNVTSMRLIERQVKDPRTLAVIRQHLFNQKRLAIGDPFSHLIANLNMSVIIRKAKAKYGRTVRLINFADDFIAFAKDKATLNTLRRDMRQWAKALRLHYKHMYIRPVPGRRARRFSGGFITFCGYRYRPAVTLLTRRTKLRYIRSRHRRRSVASYNGLLQVADTKHLRFLIETNDNQHMTEKIRRPFAGRPMKIETLEGIPHTIVDFTEKVSRQRDCEHYYHVQAIADALGLIVYSTGSSKICEYLKTRTRHDLPLRDMKIVHDWSGYYYDGTVYTDAEEEAMLRQQFNIPK